MICCILIADVELAGQSANASSWWRVVDYHVCFGPTGLQPAGYCELHAIDINDITVHADNVALTAETADPPTFGSNVYRHSTVFYPMIVISRTNDCWGGKTKEPFTACPHLLA